MNHQACMCFFLFSFFIEKEKLWISKFYLLFIHENVLWRFLLLLIPEMGFHPTNTVNSIAGRCRKVPKRTGGCRYLIFLWVIHGLFPFHLTLLPLHHPLSVTVCLCVFFPLLHHWRCANLGSAVWQSLWWSIRIADGESEGCLNAAWCLPKLCALKPSRHESSPVTAWCLPLQLGMLLGKSHP